MEVFSKTNSSTEISVKGPRIDAELNQGPKPKKNGSPLIDPVDQRKTLELNCYTEASLGPSMDLWLAFYNKGDVDPASLLTQNQVGLKSFLKNLEQGFDAEESIYLADSEFKGVGSELRTLLLPMSETQKAASSGQSPQWLQAAVGTIKSLKPRCVGVFMTDLDVAEDERFQKYERLIVALTHSLHPMSISFLVSNTSYVSIVNRLLNLKKGLLSSENCAVDECIIHH